MSLRRTLALYAALIGLFAVVLCRVYGISQNAAYAEKAAGQTVTTLSLGAARGNFYDCRGEQLTGTGMRYLALCVPGGESYARLFDDVDAAGQSVLYQKRNAAAPFLIEVDRDLTDEGIYTVRAARRYAEKAPCAHLIGYLDADGHGVSGLEAALDETLAGSGESSTVQCVTNAQGALMENTRPILHTAETGGRDVQLTIDARMQRACEGIAEKMLGRGCILVLDVPTAQVRTCVSAPGYDPADVQRSIAAQDTGLLNRAFRAYAVGSVFKPVLAAAALEQGAGALTIECTGSITVEDHTYRCAGRTAHGVTDLAAALEKSCNCYFVTLGKNLGPETLYRYASALGFGAPDYLAGGLKSAAGSLPDAAALADAGALANVSFGQGALLATPVQVAGMMNTIAAGGVYRAPAFLLRSFSAADPAEAGTAFSAAQPARVIREDTARALREMLTGVVYEGIGSEAKPAWGRAAGKTGTAQTGRRNAQGQEYKNLWFAGFYPADAPAYTVVVMQDDQIRAANSSAAVFARVCDALALLDGTGTQAAERTGENS